MYQATQLHHQWLLSPRSYVCRSQITAQCILCIYPFVTNISSFESCITKIKNWMVVYRPQRNRDETECLLFDTKDESKSTPITSMLGMIWCFSPQKQKKKNRDFFSVCSLRSQVNNLCQQTFLEFLHLT